MEFRAKDRILSVLLWAMLLFLLYRTAGLLFKLFLPFLYGFSLSWLLRPLINGISRFSCAKKSFWSFSVLLFLYLLLALGIWWTVSFILQELQQFFDSLPQLTECSTLVKLQCMHLRLPSDSASQWSSSQVCANSFR